MANMNDILRDHVTLTVDCLVRSYLNGYIPNMQALKDWWVLENSPTATL